MNTIQTILQTVIQHQNLTTPQMSEIMRLIMQGKVSATQLSAFLVAMRMKGETVSELVAACKVLQEFADPVIVKNKTLIDIVGTGGDQTHTFNISTASSFVVAAAGATVAKHGNRSVSSRCGSADVLEKAGVKLTLTPTQIATCINKLNIGFMFAQLHHPAMQHAAAARKELGFRTFFNLIGPLTNPAAAKKQLIGVFAKEWVLPTAEILQQLGSKHALVVHSVDGLDEISISADTFFAELKQGKITTGTLTAQQFGFNISALTTLQVADATESFAILQQALQNKPGAARDIVALNAGAAIYVAGLANDIASGVKQAQQLLANGAAYEKLKQLIALTQSLATES